MGKPWDSILLGYYRKFLKDGFVVITNYKMKELFIKSYFPYDNPLLKIEKINGNLKRCTFIDTRSTLTINPSVLIKYIDAGRFNEGITIEKFIEKYDNDENNHFLDFLVEIRNRIMDKSIALGDRVKALKEFGWYSNPMQYWSYYTTHYKIISTE